VANLNSSADAIAAGFLSRQSTITPSGIEVDFTWTPKRQYRVRQHPDQVGNDFLPTDWRVVPSVTDVLGCLDKPGLPYWGNKVGVDGVLELVRRGLLKWVND